MHWPIKPRPHHLRHAAGIIAIRLVDLSLQRCAHVPRLYANYGQACLSQSAEQPLRQWPRFQSDPLEVIGPVLEHLQESVRIAPHFRFADDLTCLIHNAEARQLDRYVQSSKMLHAALQADGETRSPRSPRIRASGIRRRSAAWSILLDWMYRSRKRASVLLTRPAGSPAK